MDGCGNDRGVHGCSGAKRRLGRLAVLWRRPGEHQVFVARPDQQGQRETAQGRVGMDLARRRDRVNQPRAHAFPERADADRRQRRDVRDDVHGQRRGDRSRVRRDAVDLRLRVLQGRAPDQPRLRPSRRDLLEGRRRRARLLRHARHEALVARCEDRQAGGKLRRRHRDRSRGHHAPPGQQKK